MTAARTFATVPRQSAASVLIATPNKLLRKHLSDGIGTMSTVEEAGSGAEALFRLERRGASIVLLDRHLPDLDSDELVGIVEGRFPGTDVVLLDGESGEIQLPEEMRDRALHQRLKELNPASDRVAAIPATAEVERHSKEMLLPGMVGDSEAIRTLAALVQMVAGHHTPVIITGETGAGKELVAEAVHKLSPRAERPFVTVNCAAIPETLIEAELFGHTRGAFTGAVQQRLGRIHAAQYGTIFFDEIGELPLASQSKLLRFLESGEVQRLGSSDVFRLDARVIAATNRNLEELVQKGLFREDLYFRLAVFPIEIPPLRERPGDIPLLARHFVDQFAEGRRVVLSPEAEKQLSASMWPGNVRELRNVIERALVMAEGRTTVTPEFIYMRRPCRSVRACSEVS